MQGQLNTDVGALTSHSTMSEDEVAVVKFTRRGMMRTESMAFTGTEIDMAFTGRDGHTLSTDICTQQAEF